MSFEEVLESERTKASLPRPAFEPTWTTQLHAFLERVSVAEMRMLDELAVSGQLSAVSSQT